MPTFDAIPSCFPPCLTKLELHVYLRGGTELTEALSKRWYLKKLILFCSTFRDLDVLRTVLMGCIEHQTLLSLQIREPLSFEDDETHICLTSCNGRWCKQMDEDEVNACNEITPLFGMKATIMEWHKECHIKLRALTYDADLRNRQPSKAVGRRGVKMLNGSRY
jgi:hypothetical protein